MKAVSEFDKLDPIVFYSNISKAIASYKMEGRENYMENSLFRTHDLHALESQLKPVIEKIGVSDRLIPAVFGNLNSGSNFEAIDLFHRIN